MPPVKLKYLNESRQKYLATPQGFGEGFLGINFYPVQKQVLSALYKEGCQVSFASCNDGGKTAIVLTTFILWHLQMFPAGRFVSTSGKYDQIIQQLMPSLWQFKKKFPSWHWYDIPYIETECGGFFTGISTKKPGLAEGYHAGTRSDNPLIDCPLAFASDECKSSEPWLEGVVEGRIHPTRLFLLSSHGYAEGWFYNSHTIRKQDFQCFTQRAEDCPHITKQHIENVRRKWGRSGLADSILGHGFMALVENAVIDYKQIDVALNNPPEWKTGEIHCGCDFAWSNDGDESTVFLRNGNKITMEDCFRVEGLHPLCDRLIQNFTRLRLLPHQISGDEGGGGQLVMDELDRRGWRINRWNNGSPAKDDEHFQDCKSECWYNFSELLDMHGLILPNDFDLRAQLINRKRVPGTKGRLAIETKRDMKERGVPSPDRGDGCILAAMPNSGWEASSGMGFIKPCPMGVAEQRMGW
jgi:phage terminase large subunit